MTKLYTMNVSPLCGEEIFFRALRLVSSERREKALQYRKRIDAALSLGAEILLRYALINDFKYEKLPVIGETGRGKPYFTGETGIHFNLSHSGEYAVCLISDDGEVGVDIQQIRRADMKTARRVLSQKAYEQLEAAGESERDERFCELWVLHESAVKLQGGSVFDETDSVCAKLVNAPGGYRIAVAMNKKKR